MNIMRSLLVCIVMSTVLYAADYEYAGTHHANGERKNDWNTAKSWTGGPGKYPNGKGDAIHTPGELRGDVDLFLNRDITIGNISWWGNLLYLQPGKPAGVLTVNAALQPARWNVHTYYGFRVNCNLVLQDSLVVSNRSSRELQFNGIISGPGGLKVIWQQDQGGYRKECLFGDNAKDAANTYAGGTVLEAVNGGDKGVFRARKNGAFGTGPVKLNEKATLILEDIDEADNMIADTAALYLNISGAESSTLQLEKGVNETISSLNVNGAPMPRGTYGSGESTAEYTDDRLFAGQGIMTVVSGPVPAGKINNGEGADAVTVTTARLTGEMIATRERPVTVTIYWGQRDGRNKKDDWQHSLSLGIREPGTFETILSNLNPRTEYYYRSALKNSKGTAWAGRSESFKTYGKPEIATTRPVIMREGTRLRGMLADTNGAPTVTWVYYGLSDGKKDVKAWDNSYCFGNTGNGALETNLSDLKPHTGYYCRFFATNRYGSSWADSSLSWNTAGEPGRNDITFFCISDIHFGMSPAVNAFNPSVVDMMNSAPGEHWPEKVGGGSIEPPRAIVIPGDTTCSATKEEWGMFTNYYGLVGENRLAYQVYEGWGNHDGGDWLIGEIKERNTRRPGLTAISPNGLHYSWDWDDVHCIQLNIAAGDDWHPYNPRYSYTFLTNDLATQVGNSGRPVLLFQHFSIKKHGAIDYAPEAQTNFYNAIAPYNVIGLFHGHVHDSGHYTWRGIDVFNTTHMHGESDGKPPAHGFLAVNITPKGMRVVEHKSDGKVGFTFSKPIPFLEKRKGQ